jgi:hypothetical protein
MHELPTSHVLLRKHTPWVTKVGDRFEWEPVRDAKGSLITFPSVDAASRCLLQMLRTRASKGTDYRVAPYSPTKHGPLHDASKKVKLAGMGVKFIIVDELYGHA